jgi:hypothetical protein
MEEDERPIMGEQRSRSTRSTILVVGQDCAGSSVGYKIFAAPVDPSAREPSSW